MRTTIPRLSIILLGIIVSLISCKAKLRTKADVDLYIHTAGNGLMKSSKMGTVNTTITYLPMQSAKFYSQKHKISIVPASIPVYCFVLSFSAGEKELFGSLSREDYSAIVQTFAFRMSDYIRATPDAGKPVKPLSCYYQPTYGAARSNDLVVTFDGKSFSDANDIRIKVNDFGIYTGDLNFDFKVNDIKQLHELLAD